MGESTRDERLQIMLNAEELAMIDDWRFKTRMPSRAAAIRELLRRGLDSEGFKVSDGSKSSSYGVAGNGTQADSTAHSRPVKTFTASRRSAG